MPENVENDELTAVAEAVVAETAESAETAEPTVTFGDLGLPEGIVRKLAQNGVTTPFPIQAATIPDAWPARTSSAAAVPAPARPSPSVCRPLRPGGRPHREEEAPPRDHPHPPDS